MVENEKSAEKNKFHTDINLSEKKQTEQKKDKKGKKATKVEEPRDKKDHDADFNYIVRIVNTDINGENNIVQGLTQIKGIGRHMATFIADTAGINRKIKFGNLPESEIEKIQEILDHINQYAPAWMLNYQKDMYTGKNLHLISTDIPTRFRDDVNIMKMIRSYKGIRHELGLKVRGQRTSSNGRRGLALGVSKRRDAQVAAKKQSTG